MKNLTLRQFRYFEALARHGHFGRAAEASAISQPALSVQIREMEETLGVALFERSPRGVTLTGVGREVAGRVRDILRHVDELGDLARLSRGALSGRVDSISHCSEVSSFVLEITTNRALRVLATATSKPASCSL